MKKTIKRCLSLLIAAVLTLSVSLPAAASREGAAEALERTTAYLAKTVTEPQIGMSGGEWTVLALARSHIGGSNAWFRQYAANAEETVKQSGGELSARRYTEYSRVILAMTAIGRDPHSVGGYDLTEKLLDREKVCLQGLSGPVYALLALDAAKMENDGLREDYLDAVLSHQHEDGSFGLTDAADVDMTAMALQAFAPYQGTAAVKASTEKALSYLSSVQEPDGSFASWNTVNTESSAQVLTALCTLSIPVEDSRFVKNGHTVLDALLSQQLPDGSFRHVPNGKSDLIASEQAALALTALMRQERGEAALFDMSDVKTGLPGKHKDVFAPLVTTIGKQYPDVTDGDDAALLDSLSLREVVGGYEDGTFRPARTMTRAEFATIVVRALGLAPKKITVFSDVKPGSWYAGYVGAAYEYGLVNGMTATTFEPERSISHEQAVTLALRAAKLCGVKTEFSPSELGEAMAEYSYGAAVSGWARDSVAAGICLSLLPEEDFAPKTATTRMEMAKILWKLMTEADFMDGGI